MKREIKPFEEVLQDTLSGINKEGWQVLCDTRPGVKKDRHPVTIASAGRKEEGYVIPVFCAEDVYDYYRSTKDEEAAIRYFADLFAKAQAPKTNESIQDLCSFEETSSAGLCEKMILRQRTDPALSSETLP